MYSPTNSIYYEEEEMSVITVPLNYFYLWNYKLMMNWNDVTSYFWKRGKEKRKKLHNKRGKWSKSIFFRGIALNKKSLTNWIHPSPCRSYHRNASTRPTASTNSWRLLPRRWNTLMESSSLIAYLLMAYPYVHRKDLKYFCLVQARFTLNQRENSKCLSFGIWVPFRPYFFFVCLSNFLSLSL